MFPQSKAARLFRQPEQLLALRCFYARRFSTMRVTAVSTSAREVARFMRTQEPKRSPPNQSP